MFSIRQKREISEKVQQILRETKHPELPSGEIYFELKVHGEQPWSWALIQNNGAVVNPVETPHNERMDPRDYLSTMNENWVPVTIVGSKWEEEMETTTIPSKFRHRKMGPQEIMHFKRERPQEFLSEWIPGRRPDFPEVQ